MELDGRSVKLTYRLPIGQVQQAEQEVLAADPPVVKGVCLLACPADDPKAVMAKGSIQAHVSASDLRAPA